MIESNKYILSIVICGRNDNYLGDFKYKITTSLNYLCSNIVRLKKQSYIEVIFVDWNSNVPLFKDIELIPCAREIVKFVIIPPAIAFRYNSHHSEFNANCAMNAGIQRADGEYIVIMCGDTLMPSISLQNLILLLEQKLDAVFDTRKTLINIGRKYIPWQKVKTKPNLAEWEQYLQLHSRHLVYDNGFCGLSGGYGAILLHKNIWHQSHGLIENFAGWGGSDVEQSARICMQYPYIDPIYFGIVVYDMTETPAMKVRKETSFHYNFIEFPKKIDLGNQSWGLQDHHLEIVVNYPVENFNNSIKINKNRGEEVLFNRSQIINEISKIRPIEIICYFLKTTHLHFPQKGDWACLLPLAWYFSKINPSKYIEIGKSDGHSFLIVTRLVHSVEIYGLNTFDHLKCGEDLSHNLSRNGYMGYLRFVIGNPQETLSNLGKSFIGDMSFNAVLFRLDLFRKDVFERFTILFNYLEPNGIIIVTAKDSELFLMVWKFIERAFPSYICIGCNELNTGFLIKHFAQRDDMLQINIERVLSSAWKYPQTLRTIYELQFFARKIFNKFYETHRNHL